MAIEISQVLIAILNDGTIYLIKEFKIWHNLLLFRKKRKRGGKGKEQRGGENPAKHCLSGRPPFR